MKVITQRFAVVARVEPGVGEDVEDAVFDIADLLTIVPVNRPVLPHER